MDEAPGAKKWLPLEANPDVMNQFLQGLGLSSGSASFFDVYGFDDDLLSMVPTPVLAVLFLFPITAQSEAAAEIQKQKRQEENKVSDNVYFMKQTVGNACGTIGLLHAVGNNLSELTFDEGSNLQKFYSATARLSPYERASYLEEAVEIEGAHTVAASAGDTLPPAPNVPVDLHFICFVCVDGGIYELDGRKEGPVYHGISSPETFLKDSVQVIQKFIARNPDSVDFNVIAFSKGP